MEILPLLTSPEVWIAFFTLTALELVLGIDNIIFISILVDRLPKETREKARKIGLFFAMFMRIALLLLLSWIVGATEPLFSIFKMDISPRDLILIGGGIFLLWKSTQEIHQLLEGEEGKESNAIQATFSAIIFQIIVIDLVFSLDSIITAVGMVKQVPVMVIAVLVSTFIMMLTVNTVSNFVERHPTVKILALSFLLLIGTNLLAEAAHYHIPKGYVYFAMAFSVFVETINIKASARRNPHPVQLNPPA